MSLEKYFDKNFQEIFRLNFLRNIYISHIAEFYEITFLY